MAELRSAKQPILRYRRFHGWDYAKGASLFITIATEPRHRLFGRVEDGAMVLSPLGQRVKEALEAIPKLNPGITLYGPVVMPDHVHLLLEVHPQFGIHKAVKTIKGKTSRILRQDFP